MLRAALLALGVLLAAAPTARSQTYGPALDPFFSDWHTAPIHLEDGLSKQALFPGTLHAVTSFQHAVLAAHASTPAIRLSGRQQIYFVESGEGTVSAGKQTVRLAKNIALLMPSGLEFTLKNPGESPLALYVIEEPTTPQFHPNLPMLVRNENDLPFSTTDLQWAYLMKPIFTAQDGLATLTSVATISLDPLTVSRPVSTVAPTETVWLALHGTGIAFVSNNLRRQPPGTAFLDIPDGKTPHSIVNPSEDQQIRFLYFTHQAPPAPKAKAK